MITAKKLGLKVIKTGTNVESSTSQKIEANIAIADSIYIGDILFENVVFLVMPLSDEPSLAKFIFVKTALYFYLRTVKKGIKRTYFLVVWMAYTLL